MRTYAIRGMVALASVATLVAACGGSDSKKSNTPAAGGATVAATKPAAASTARADVNRLSISAKDFSFTTDATSIRPGSPAADVTFKNDGAATHTLTFYEDSAYTKKLTGSGNVLAGQMAAFAVTAPTGATNVFYRCDIHPAQMKGELAVKQ